MKDPKEKSIGEKQSLHPRNIHRQRYDFELLIKNHPELVEHIFINTHGIETLDFSNPKSVKSLNKALLASYYNIREWDIPNNYLCPPIPGRADYIHYVADLLALNNHGKVPKGNGVVGLDIGVGSNCIYPILGHSLYDWSFVATDIDEKAIDNCVKIVTQNESLKEAISFQQQLDPSYVFKHIIQHEDRFSFTICNPPFHANEAEALKSSIRKISNLTKRKISKPILNHGGQSSELWTEGGEIVFVNRMIHESKFYPLEVLWFTCLVSKADNLKSIYKSLDQVGVFEFKTIEMSQGHKISRIVAWTFQNEIQQQAWNFELNTKD